MGIKHHWRLTVVLLIYVVLAVTHSLTVPLGTGNDEWAHFLYIRFIAEIGHLPATMAERDEAGYKSDAPPLYHLLVSAVASGVEPVHLLRTLDSPRRELADNLTNPYALLHTGVELPPYRGEVLIWYLGRGISIFFGTILIFITYITGLELFPRCYDRSLLASALLAFTPALVFHSSVLSYESLSAVLTALVLWVSIKAIKQPQRWLWWPSLGILVGLSITTKYSAVLLPLEVVLVAWLVFRVVKNTTMQTAPNTYLVRRYFVGPVLIAGVFTMLAAGWWFGFVIWNFNKIDASGPVIGILEPLLIGDASDTTSVSVGTFLFGHNAISAPMRPLLERHYGEFFQLLLDSFWAAPVNGAFFMSPWLSGVFGLLALSGLLSLGWVWYKNRGLSRIWLILLLFHTLLVVPLLVTRALFSFDPREVAQGRHILLPAASAIAILLVWGWSQWHYQISRVVIVAMLLWCVLGQIGWAAVIYPAPIPVWTSSLAPPSITAQHSLNHTFVDTLRLTGADWRQRPGENALEVTLTWNALAENYYEDYLFELQLTDELGQLASYTIGQPVQGRYPTRAWEPDDVVKDVHWLPLVDLLAGKYQLQLRLLDRYAQPVSGESPVLLGEITLTQPARQHDPCLVWFQGQPVRGGLLDRPFRLRESFIVVSSDQPVLQPSVDRAGASEQTPLVYVGNFHVFVVEPDWLDTYQLVVGSKTCQELTFDLPARHFTPPPIANPLASNFNNQVKLLGYELPARRIEPGGRLPLTLYWQALDYMGEDYQIFDNLLDRNQNRWGGYDRRARDGYSTLLWTPGEVISDAFGVPVDRDTPPGIYTVDLGLYRQIDNGPISLPLIVEGQLTGQTSIRLGPIKVGGPPPEIVVAEATPLVGVNQSLGDQITLLGYDLVPQVDSLALILYWQANVSPRVDYTTFVHLRNESNQTIAQKDSPPASGQYPTSLWDSGEVIVDKTSLPLDNVPSGTYTLAVGLYDPVTGERLPVPGNPANEVLLETVELP